MEPATIVVDLTMAVICFAGSCHPVLIGKTTPIGEFTMTRYAIDKPEYGGDLLVFKEEGDEVWAIHRVLDLPGQKRLERLRSKKKSSRRNVTLGCINIDPEVYDALVDCCSKFKLVIKR